MLNKILRNIIILYYKIKYNKKLEIGNIIFRRRFNINISYNGKLHIGNGVFFNNDCSINCHEKIFIGNNTIFGENVKIYDHNHKYRNVNIPIIDQGYRTGEIFIGNNCWIASNVIILNNVHIGDNTVIGAGVIVYKDVPPNSVVICKQNLEIKSISKEV